MTADVLDLIHRISVAVEGERSATAARALTAVLVAAARTAEWSLKDARAWLERCWRASSP